MGSEMCIRDRYDAHVLRDLDRNDPARPRQHPSCTAAAAAAAAVAVFCLLSATRYILVHTYSYSFFVLSLLLQAGGLLAFGS